MSFKLSLDESKPNILVALDALEKTQGLPPPAVAAAKAVVAAIPDDWSVRVDVAGHVAVPPTAGPSELMLTVTPHKT